MRFPSLPSLIPGLLAISAALYLGLVLLWDPVTPVPWDATHMYLPLARQFLERGVALLFSPDSVRAAPMSYLWPALFRAELSAIRLANIVAGAILCLLVFDTARRIHSPWAGAIAAWSVSLSPLLRPYIPEPLTETQFLLFTAIWWWGMAGYLQGKRIFLLPAVIGGSLSVLTRQVWLYPILLSAFVSALWWFAQRNRTVARVLLVHALIAVAPLVVMGKNYALFHHPVVATGAGGAIYFGQHPLTGGFEPSLLGLVYDERPVLGLLGVDHLTPLGDKVLSRIGFEWLRVRPVADSLSELPVRVGRVLFFGNRGLAPTPYNTRALRIAEIWLALIAVIAAWRVPIVALLGAGLALQTAQLSILLFNDRYSIGTLEYGLILLASIGLVATFRPIVGAFRQAFSQSRFPSGPTAGRAVARPFLVAFLCTASIAGGYWVQRFVAPAEARMPSDERLVRALTVLAPPEIWSDRQQAFLPDHEVVVTSELTVVRVRVSSPQRSTNANLLWRIRATVTPASGKRCRRSAIQFFYGASQVLGTARNILLQDDGQPHDYTLGAHSITSGLFPAENGELQLRFACSEATKIKVHEAVLYESQIPAIYAPRAQAIANELR